MLTIEKCNIEIPPKTVVIGNLFLQPRGIFKGCFNDTSIRVLSQKKLLLASSTYRGVVRSILLSLAALVLSGCLETNRDGTIQLDGGAAERARDAEIAKPVFVGILCWLAVVAPSMSCIGLLTLVAVVVFRITQLQHVFALKGGLPNTIFRCVEASLATQNRLTNRRIERSRSYPWTRDTGWDMVTVTGTISRVTKGSTTIESGVYVSGQVLADFGKLGQVQAMQPLVMA